MSQFTQKFHQLKRDEQRLEKRLAYINEKLAPLLASQAELEHLLRATQDKIQTLQTAEEIIQDDTPLHFGKLGSRAFKGKVNQLIMRVLKTNPDIAFNLSELVIKMLALDNQSNTKPIRKHAESARKILIKLEQKGVIVKAVIDGQNYWQWRS